MNAVIVGGIPPPNYFIEIPMASPQNDSVVGMEMVGDTETFVKWAHGLRWQLAGPDGVRCHGRNGVGQDWGSHEPEQANMGRTQGALARDYGRDEGPCGDGTPHKLAST